MENHDEILSNFLNVTGWPIDMCKDVLIGAGWNLSEALKLLNITPSYPTSSGTEMVSNHMSTKNTPTPSFSPSKDNLPKFTIHEDNDIQSYETDLRWKVQITSPNTTEIKQNIMKHCPTVFYRYIEFSYINSGAQGSHNYQIIDPISHEISYVIGQKYISEQALFEAIDSWLECKHKAYHSVIGRNDSYSVNDEEMDTDSQTDSEQTITILVQISGGKRFKISIEDNKSMSKLFSRISMLSKIKEEELLLKTYNPYQILKKSNNLIFQYNLDNSLIVATKK